ncbi:hypothetical protein AF72_11695 [Xylella taiwanensis]|uniref:Uncharacterized protein n=1 Tax=Xylella taiwanensis TaxID=1444770 RepID=Z9JHQ5_9GAMM|nr:hypothetical protein AF72_11695 [Xylella taiwanensis]
MGTLVLPNTASPSQSALPPQCIGQIVSNNHTGTTDMALRLSKFFGRKDRFWLGLHMDYYTNFLHNAWCSTKATYRHGRILSIIHSCMPLHALR